MNRSDLKQALSVRNVQAFLKVIRLGEGTSDPAGYRRMFGGRHFDSFADHPRIKNTYTLNGKPISSTAAGAYQFLERTWDGLVGQYGFTDFEPDTQDEAAVALIAGRNALEDVISGRLDSAIKKCAKEWASLPGSPYGQPTISMEKAKARYAEEGGTFEETSMPIPAFVAAAGAELLKELPGFIRGMGKDGSQVAERNAKIVEAVSGPLVDIAKAVTNQPTAEGAVTAIQQDPELASQFREQAYKQRLELSELAEKSVAAAREFNRGEAPLWGNVRFVHVLSIVMVLLTGIGGIIVLAGSSFSADLKASVVTLMIVGGWTAVVAYWLGSSAGSHRKDELRRE